MVRNIADKFKHLPVNPKTDNLEGFKRFETAEVGFGSEKPIRFWIAGITTAKELEYLLMQEINTAAMGAYLYCCKRVPLKNIISYKTIERF